ncbi:MAG: hypothetical protein GWO79_00840, partial [Actinobacteria bacterium]|nr:hypothetical protein [Actinomycetota bacterium]
MKIIKIDFKKINKEETNLIVDYLNRGKVIVYPTDTIYGIGCIATDRKAINRIYKIKKRDKRKPLLILVSSLAMLKKYCYVSKRQEEYLRNVWMITSQRPFNEAGALMKNPPSHPLLKGGRMVSVILRSRGVLPKELAGGEDSVAARLPNSEFLVKIIRRANVPIVSTSLNISGRNNLADISEIEQYFKSPRLLFDKEGNDKKSPQPLFTKEGNNEEPPNT